MRVLPKSRGISNGVPLHSYTIRTGTHLEEPMPQRNPKQLSVPTRKQCIHDNSRREYRARNTQDCRVRWSLAHGIDTDRVEAESKFPVGPAEPRHGTTESVRPAIYHLSNDEYWGEAENRSSQCPVLGHRMISYVCSPSVLSARRLDLRHTGYRWRRIQKYLAIYWHTILDAHFGL